MKERNPIQDAVRYALTAGVAASFASIPSMAFAQDDEDIAEQGLIEVTGSRIKRVDVEGPSPVAVITRADIENSGDISVADVLRQSSYNQFGSFRQSSGSSAQSQAVISLRGLGATRTLLLLDGRRMAGSPTFGAGSAGNLNVIPIRGGNDVLVHGSYQSGVSVVDFTDPTHPVELAFSDPPAIVPLDLGGSWSAYWYNNFIYETNITEGLNIFRFSGKQTAGALRLDHLNPQTQEFTID